MIVITEDNRVPRTMHMYKCPKCGHDVFKDSEECIHCHDIVRWKHEVSQCSICKRYEGIDGIWRKKPDQTVIERDLAKGIIGNISETLCKDCLDDMMEDI